MLRFLWSEESEAEVRESRELKQKNTPMTSDDIFGFGKMGKAQIIHIISNLQPLITT
jgi:hypothetical protein